MMKVPLSYLLDQMEPWGPRWAFDISENVSPKVSRVSPFRETGETLRNDTLYLCLDELPLHGAPLPERAYFVTAAGAGEELPRRISLERPPAQSELLDRLLDAADRLQAWLDDLVRLSLDKASPQEFLDVSEEMLENPVLIQDPSYTMIAITRSASVQDYPFFDFGGTRRPMPEFLLQSQREASVRKRYTVEGEGRGIIREYAGKPEIIHNVTFGDNIYASLIYAISRVELTQGRFDLFLMFCRYFRYSLDPTVPYMRPDNFAGFAFEQLLRFDNQDVIHNLLRPKAGWRFTVAVLRMDAPESEFAAYLPQTQEVLPHSVACYYNGQITVLLCVADQESEAVYYEYQYQRLDSLAEVMNGVFGLSYRIPSLTGVHSALQQSKKALQLLPLFPPEGGGQPTRLRFYADAAITDIIEETLTGGGAERFLPPEIIAIWTNDAKNGERNGELLYSYLLTGKSLAQTSEMLHIHRSTIVYRLQRMKEKYDLQLDQMSRNQLYLLSCLVCQAQKRHVRGGA